MDVLRRITCALLVGGLAGLAALALDEALARLTLGHFVPIFALLGLAYVASGALAGLVVEGVACLSRRPSGSAVGVFAWSLGALYVPPVIERVHHLLGRRVPMFWEVVAVALVVLGCLIGILALRAVLPASSRRLAPAFMALAAALGLAANRNFVTSAFGPVALAADAVIVAAVLTLCGSMRLRAGRRIAAVAATLFVGGLAISYLGRSTQSPRRVYPAPEPTPPHLVLAVIDTLRQDVFQAVVEETEEGRAFRSALGGAAWFSQALSAAPWTVPSMGSIMTGLYPPEHGFTAPREPGANGIFTRLPDTVPTLADELLQRGYATGAIVANPVLQPPSGIGRGFELYELLSGPTVKLPLATALWRMGWLRRDYYQKASAVRHRLAARLPELTREGRPAFLWLHLMDPHDPLKKHRGLSPDPEGAGLATTHRLYRDEARYALRELTLMFEMLQAHGLWDNAVVVVVSDHGEMFSSDGHDHHVPAEFREQTRHGFALYGELVRVPLVIRPAGGLASDRHVDALASHVDLFDTIADLLGLDLPRIGRDRISLAPWLTPTPPELDSAARRVQAVMSDNRHGPPQRALRTWSHKLIDYQGQRPQELYDIVADPGESHDLEKVGAEYESLVRDLEAIWSVLEQAPEAAAPSLDAETRRRLRALGYVE